MAEAVFQALKGVIQMAVQPGSAAAGIVMQVSVFAAMALAVRVVRRLIQR